MEHGVLHPRQKIGAKVGAGAEACEAIACIKVATSPPTAYHHGGSWREMGLQEEGVEDLAPLPLSQRPWRWHTFTALWVAMLANPSMYSLGGSLISLGLGPVEALTCAAVGGAFTASAMVANSVPGVAFGIPFPVYARSAYGMQGAKLAALSRGLVGVFWLSFQLWLAADSLFHGLLRVAPALRTSPAVWLPYLNLAQLALLLLVAIVHVGLISMGAWNFGKLTYGVVPFCIGLFVMIAVWAVTPGWGGVDMGEVLHLQTGRAEAAGHSWLAWLGGINAVVSNFSTLLLNMSDLARLAPRQFDQASGQLLGIPVPMLFTCGVGILGASAVRAKGGTSSWLMVGLFPYWPAWGCVLTSVLIFASTVTVNLGANIIPPANDFMNLSPMGLRWRWCAYATIVLAVLACPFCLFHSATGFALRFIGGYGMITGAIYGVMVADFYIVRGRRLDLDDLYPAKPGEGACEYYRGHNWRAILATLLGIALPFIPWLAHVVGHPMRPMFWCICDKASWLLSCPVAAVVYVGACKLSPPQPMSEGSLKKIHQDAPSGQVPSRHTRSEDSSW